MENKTNLTILEERVRRIKLLANKEIDLTALQERAKNIKLLVTDLDGTILDRNNNLSGENRKALMSLADKGIILAIATNRTHKYIPEVVKALDGIKYLISSNGAKINSNETNEILYESFLTPGAIEYVKPLLTDDKIYIEVFWNGNLYIEEVSYTTVCDYASHYRLGDNYYAFHMPIRGLYSVILDHIHEIESIRFFFTSDVIKKRMRSFLEARTDLYSLTSYHPFNFEISGIGVNKASAVDYIATREEICSSEIVCLGDNENDVDMIKYAGIGIATADATWHALVAADIIADGNKQTGIATTLRILGLI